MDDDIYIENDCTDDTSNVTTGASISNKKYSLTSTWDPAWALFIMQAVVTFLAMTFGLILTFLAHQETVGVSLVSGIVSLWMQSPTDAFFSFHKQRQRKQKKQRKRAAKYEIKINNLSNSPSC